MSHTYRHISEATQQLTPPSSVSVTAMPRGGSSARLRSIRRRDVSQSTRGENDQLARARTSGRSAAGGIPIRLISSRSQEAH